METDLEYRAYQCVAIWARALDQFEFVISMLFERRLCFLVGQVTKTLISYLVINNLGLL